jgi:hypothetical protein
VLKNGALGFVGAEEGGMGLWYGNGRAGWWYFLCLWQPLPGVTWYNVAIHGKKVSDGLSIAEITRRVKVGEGGFGCLFGAVFAGT